MIERGGRPVLMDFGIARAQGGSSVTQVGVSIGTPRYMAPEQVRGVEIGPAVDVYALGVVAYELLSGKPPFVGDTASVLHAQVYDPPPPLRELRPGLPEGIYAAIDAALAKQAADRPASAGAFAALLQAAHETPAAPASTPAHPQDLTTLMMPPEPASGATSTPIAVPAPAESPAAPPPATPPQVTPAFTPQYLPAYPEPRPSDTPAPLPAAGGRGRLFAAIGVVIAALALGGGALAVALARGGGNHQAAKATVVAGASGAAATPPGSGTPSPSGTASLAGAATVTNLQVYDSSKREHAGTFLAGDFVDVCFSLAPGSNPTRPLIALTNHSQPPKGDNDPSLVGLSPPLALAAFTDRCFEVRSTRQRLQPGDYVAWVMQGQSLDGAVVLASAPFHLLAATPSPAPSGTATATATPAASATPSRSATPTPRPTPSPTRAAALPTPDLSLPPNPNAGAGRPSLKITAVQVVTPNDTVPASDTFAFKVTAQNVGAAGREGSISVSSPDAARLAAQIDSCDMTARANVFAPGSAIAALGNGTRTGTDRITSTHWLAEADVNGAWPANASCTLTVTASVPGNGDLTFYLRTATFASDDRIVVWPYTGSGVGSVDNDQQGFRAIRWVLPISQT